MECMTYVAFNWANKAQLPLPALDMPHKESCSREIDAVREGEGKEGKESVELPSNVTHFWLSIPAV